MSQEILSQFDNDDVVCIKTIRQAIRLLFDENQIVELRALRTKRGTVSGCFDGAHREELATCAAAWSGQSESVYVTLNPVDSAALARSANCVTPYAKHTTSDKEILHRRWLFIDFDPKRISGVSSTDDELMSAIETARECRSYLSSQGWPEPLIAMSGNGAHALYRIDLPNTEESTRLVKGVLAELANRFDSQVVTVDRSVFNAARICKLYGTLAAKGSSTLERPHRIARFIDVPTQLAIVQTDQLKAIVENSESEPLGKSVAVNHSPATGFDVGEWLKRHNLEVRKEKPWQNGCLWELSCCPWKPDSDDGGAWVAKLPDGSVVAGCHHHHCEKNGWSELRDLLEPGWRASDINQRNSEALDDPHRLARLFLLTYFRHEDGRTLNWYRGSWFEWSKNRWSPVSENDIRARLMKLVKAEFDRNANGSKVRKVVSSLMHNVLEALRSESHIDSALECPAWLGEEIEWSPCDVLPAANALVHLPSLVQGLECTRPSTPLFFSTNCLDYDFVPTAEEPTRWLEFLASLWPGDPESIATLQEWMGYLLTSDTRQQKILMLIGPKRSGKSTIGRIITLLVGRSNVAGPTLTSLTTNFGLASLVGKSVAIIADARLGRRSDIAVIVERLLSISGEDLITVDRKYQSAIDVRLGTRLIIISNELPHWNDASGALVGRIVLLCLTNNWFGREDTSLQDRLVAELPAIFLWCIKGWQRLRERGRFTQPESGKLQLKDLDELSSPVSAFVNELCEIGAGYQVPKEELYSEYQKWCDKEGVAHIVTNSTFGRNLRALVPTLGEKQVRLHGDKRQRCYTGIRLVAVTD